jgi:RNA-binding protein
MKPIVHLGKGGIDDGLVAAVDQALTDHELVKIKIGENAEVDRHAVADDLAARTNSELAQVIGNIVLLYRPHPEVPTIKLPVPRPGEPDEPNDANGHDPTDRTRG